MSDKQKKTAHLVQKLAGEAMRPLTYAQALALVRRDAEANPGTKRTCDERARDVVAAYVQSTRGV